MKESNKKLEELKGNSINPFTVPEGYFENFPTKLQEKLVSERTEWFVRLFSYIKPQFALGFMIVAFGIIAYTTVNLILSHKNTNGIDKELYTRIMDVDPSQFSEQHFIDIMMEEEMKVNNHKNDETDFYIHYLIDEDIDYGTLVKELEKKSK